MIQSDSRPNKKPEKWIQEGPATATMPHPQAHATAAMSHPQAHSTAVMPHPQAHATATMPHPQAHATEPWCKVLATQPRTAKVIIRLLPCCMTRAA